MLSYIRIRVILLFIIIIVYASFVRYVIDDLIPKASFSVINNNFQSELLSDQNKKNLQNITTSVFEGKQESNVEQDVTILKTKFFEYMTGKLVNTSYPGVEHYTQYVISKFKLKPLTGIRPLQPEFGPVFNNITSFHYPIGITPCQYVNGKINIFVAIISAVGNFEEREKIRQTWLRTFHQINNAIGSLIYLSGYGFITGQTKNESIHLQIEEEGEKHSDVLQINFIDNYYNLTHKVVGLVNWLNNHCSGVDFMLKVDDDVFVNVRYLVEVITKTLNRSELIIYGTQTRHWPQRGGKWNISYEDWPWSNYPDYPNGGSVLLPGIAIGPLLAAAQTTPYFPFEDTYLLGLCGEKAGIKIREYKRYFVLVRNRAPCSAYNSITWLVSLLDTMNDSYKVTEELYRNVTKCRATEIYGIFYQSNIYVPDFPSV